MLVTRLITAAIGIPLIAGAVWVGDGLLAAVVAVAVAIATLEFANARGVMRAPTSLLSAGAAASLPLIATQGEQYLLGAMVGVIGVMGAALTLTKDPQRDVNEWLWGIAAPLYLGGLAAYWLAYWALWLDAGERALVRQVVRRGDAAAVGSGGGDGG